MNFFGARKAKYWRLTNRQKDRYADGQTDRQFDRKTERQSDEQTRQTDGNSETEKVQ